jgi:predicted esterase
MDRRIAAAVSNCGFSSFQAIFEQAILHNPALYVPGLAAHGGLDRVLGLVAPRPFLAVAGSGDAIFPLAGVQATVRGARRAYAGAKDRLGLEIFPVGHDFAAPMRETAYAWLGRWLRPGGRQANT